MADVRQLDPKRYFKTVGYEKHRHYIIVAYNFEIRNY